MGKCLLRFCALSSSLKNCTIVYVVSLSLFAATGGVMFGYDIGVSGGVTVMDDFLCQFFPGVLITRMNREGTKHPNCKYINKEALSEGESRKNNTRGLYCLFGSEQVQLFTSSLYLAAMAGTCLAAYVSRRGGRKVTIFLAGIFYDVGVALNISSGSIHNSRPAAFSMLIFGRIMLGLGVGFGNQAVPLYISEIAPANIRGALNYLFQLCVTIGILVATIVNLKAEKIHPWGWRLSLGLAGIPALLMTFCSLLLIETPNSLVQRGFLDEAQKVLKKLRGEDYDAAGAVQELVAASCGTRHTLVESSHTSTSTRCLRSTHTLNSSPSNLSSTTSAPSFNSTTSAPSFNSTTPLISSPSNVNKSTIAPSFNSTPLLYSLSPLHEKGSMSPSLNGPIEKQQMNGIFARSNRPPLVIAIAVQFSQQFTGINVVIMYAPVLFKAFGSKTEASLYSALAISIVNFVFTLVSIVLVDRLGRRALLLEASVQMFVTQLLVGIILIGTKDEEKLATWKAVLVLVLVCAYVSAFAWSWGPLGWLISTEIFPLACRSEGQSVSVFFNMLFTFLIAHTSLSMLCSMKFAIFFFFAMWEVVMGILTYFFLPETMNMEIEIMSSIWSYHWFWKRFVALPLLIPSTPTCASPHPASSPHIQMSNTIHPLIHHIV